MNPNVARFLDQLSEAEQLYKIGQTREAMARLVGSEDWGLPRVSQIRLLTLEGVALFELGDAVASLERLGKAAELARDEGTRAHFSAVFMRFVRATDFQTADELLPELAELRQLASRIGDDYSLSGLHLAVARIEGLRGHCVNAHRHLEIARRCAARQDNEALRCLVDMVEGGLELMAGNMSRSRALHASCLQRAESFRFSKYILGSLTNLASVALHTGAIARAKQGLVDLLPQIEQIEYVRLGALDALAQVALHEGDLHACATILSQCDELTAASHNPAPSWYDLVFQITRCAYHERLGDWARVVEICDATDREVARRQYKAIRTALLCAKARALARLGEFTRANQAIATAVRVCPRGAIDPQIVLEATKASCLTLQGDPTTGAAHFDRSLAACRAIGHKYHEAWITRERENLFDDKSRVSLSHRDLKISDAALLLTDVTAVLGAGHSLDLLAQRTASILRSTALASRVEIEDESGCEFQPEPDATCQSGTDGVFTIRLRGSDRRLTIRVRDVRTIDEISLVTSVSDLVQAAMNRTADTENEDDDQTLWPRTLAPNADDTIFRSPHMVELLKIAARLAHAPLPILITGETGTGKEIIARMIHDLSQAKRGPFVPFNCAATPRELVESQLFGHRRGAFTGATESFQGLIRSAERGTLFLDEIGDLDHAVQPKLLRFLESGEVQSVGDARAQRVDVRVVSATNANVEEMVQQGRFRSDLYYRIVGARIALPPLRERKDEIPALASLFLSRYSRECQRAGLRMADDLVAALLLYDWPGNIRELANEIRRIVALAADGAMLSSTDLAPQILKRWNERPVTVAVPSGPTVNVRLDQSLASAIDDLEQRFIEHALHSSGGRVTEAAERLGVSRKGLFLKRRRRGMVPTPSTDD